MSDATLAGLLMGGQECFSDLLVVLNETFLPDISARMNRGDNIDLLGKLRTELLRVNARNRTDARTRIGGLIEYTLARHIDDAWQALPGVSLRLGFIPANQYPDLVARDASFRQRIRFEVKAVQAISEERAANFQTLLRDVWRHHDILCVLVWDWARADRAGVAVDYPHIHHIFAFDAYTVAQVRDISWLHQTKYRMPKAIDIGGATVPTTQDANCPTVKKEEDNLGKLTRLIDPKRLQGLPALGPFREDPDVQRYLRFIATTADLGKRAVAAELLERLGCPPAATSPAPPSGDGPTAGIVPAAILAIGMMPDNRRVIVVTGSMAVVRGALRGQPEGLVIRLGDKFHWTGYDLRVLRRAPCLARLTREQAPVSQLTAAWVSEHWPVP